jgi:hypothetical protein
MPSMPRCDIQRFIPLPVYGAIESFSPLHQRTRLVRVHLPESPIKMDTAVPSFGFQICPQWTIPKSLGEANTNIKQSHCPANANSVWEPQILNLTFNMTHGIPSTSSHGPGAQIAPTITATNWTGLNPRRLRVSWLISYRLDVKIEGPA